MIRFVGFLAALALSAAAFGAGAGIPEAKVGTEKLLRPEAAIDPARANDQLLRPMPREALPRPTEKVDTTRQLPDSITLSIIETNLDGQPRPAEFERAFILDGTKIASLVFRVAPMSRRRKTWDQGEIVIRTELPMVQGRRFLENLRSDIEADEVGNVWWNEERLHLTVTTEMLALSLMSPNKAAKLFLKLSKVIQGRMPIERPYEIRDLPVSTAN